MKKYIIILLLIIVSFSKCQNYRNIKKISKDVYKKSISFLDKNLVNHFPQKLPDSCSFATSIPKTDRIKLCGFSVDCILLWKQYSLSKYIELKNHFKESSKAHYSSQDTSLLLLFSYCDIIEIEGEIYTNQESLYKKHLAHRNITIANSLPVPLFEIDEYKGSTLCGLVKDFTLYVLDADSGKFLPNRYLQECEYLPNKWKHGYSKGVAMSDKRHVVIYWVIVW